MHITVELKERSYPIIIEHGGVASIGRYLRDSGFKDGEKAAVITNPLVSGLYAEKAVKGLDAAGFSPFVVTVPDGEEHKTLTEAAKVYDCLIERRMERSSLIVALGGGVVGDLAGFVAATYLRGVPFVQVPTTLLAQVDSSVGGKTGVNSPKGKNLIGAFYQPKAVFIDPEVLRTLDPREMKAGLAEVVKYGVIWDKDLFAFLEKNASSLLMPGVELNAAIAASCRIKAEVVGKDEREAGLRAILNFGHTFGHGLEASTNYMALRHGEAVAIGMVMATRLSETIGACKTGLSSRLSALLVKIGLPVKPPPVPMEAVIASMKLDKKVAGEKMRFVLVAEVGKVILKDVSEAELEAFLAKDAVNR